MHRTRIRTTHPIQISIHVKSEWSEHLKVHNLQTVARNQLQPDGFLLLAEVAPKHKVNRSLSCDTPPFYLHGKPTKTWSSQFTMIFIFFAARLCCAGYACQRFTQALLALNWNSFGKLGHVKSEKVSVCLIKTFNENCVTVRVYQCSRWSTCQTLKGARPGSIMT